MLPEQDSREVHRKRDRRVDILAVIYHDVGRKQETGTNQLGEFILGCHARSEAPEQAWRVLAAHCLLMSLASPRLLSPPLAACSHPSSSSVLVFCVFFSQRKSAGVLVAMNVSVPILPDSDCCAVTLPR